MESQDQKDLKTLECKLSTIEGSDQKELTCWVKVTPENFHIYAQGDSISLANDFGRLDLISTLLAIFGIGLGLVAFIGFGYFKYVAEKTAEKTADKVARKVAQQYYSEFDPEKSETEMEPKIEVEEFDVSSAIEEKETESKE